MRSLFKKNNLISCFVTDLGINSYGYTSERNYVFFEFIESIEKFSKKDSKLIDFSKNEFFEKNRRSIYGVNKVSHKS